MRNPREIVADFEKKHGIKKYRDQHFMVDEKTIELIIKKADLKKDDVVLEIGPGLGFLTAPFCEKAKKVIAVEKDESLADYLCRILRKKNLEIICSDGIEYLRNASGFNKIVSNIPYSISEPLIMELIRNKFDACVLTVPKKFADSIVQPIDSESATKMSMICQSFFLIGKVQDLDRIVFYPEPRKDSSVIEIKPRKDYKGRKREFILRELFLQEKKKLKNALMEALINYDKKYGKKEITKRSAKDIIKKVELGETGNKIFSNLNKKEIVRILNSL